MIIIIFSSCVPEEENNISVIFDLGELDTVQINLYDNLYSNIPDSSITRVFNLSNLNRNAVFTASVLGNGSPSMAIRTDSVVIVLNGDRELTSGTRQQFDPVFSSSFYIRDGNAFAKFFTQEDYDNAEPIN
jgi:hypothetical protein